MMRSVLFVGGHAHGQRKVMQYSDNVITMVKAEPVSLATWSVDPNATMPTSYVEYHHRAHIPGLNLHAYGEAGIEITHHEVVDALRVARLPYHYPIHWSQPTPRTWISQDELRSNLDLTPPTSTTPAPFPDSWDDEPWPEDLQRLEDKGDREPISLPEPAQPHDPDLPRGAARTFSHSHSGVPHPSDPEVLERAEALRSALPTWSWGKCLSTAQEHIFARRSRDRDDPSSTNDVNPPDRTSKPVWGDWTRTSHSPWT